MTPSINGVMLAVGGSLPGSIVAKVTLATALGLIGARAARRSRASVRHALLTATFGVLLVLPLASIVTPPFRIAVPAAHGRVVAGATPLFPPAFTMVGVAAVPRQPGLSSSALLLSVWIGLTTLFLLPVVMGLWQVRSLRRCALPWRRGQSLVEGLALHAGIHRRVEVLLHQALPGPMTCGVLHPAIMLPSDAQTWEAADLNRAVVHELEHVRRGDWVSHGLARAVCAVYWFHPLVWIAWRHLALEAERSCDDAVLGGSEATAYADQLVRLAQRLSTAAKSPLVAMANRADLAARVGAVLDSRQRRGRAGTFPVALACAAAASLVLTMSPIRMVAAPQAAGTEVNVTPARLLATSALVVETVQVLDQSGKNMEGLSANDFLITEDGVPQTISIYEYQAPAGTSQTRQDQVSSYYIVGYYTTSSSNVDGKFRKIAIALKESTTARLEYRPGYYTRSSKGAAFDGVPNGGAGNGVDLSIRPPALLFRKEPEYSEEARKAKLQGAVVLQVDVDVSGQAANIKVIHALGLGLDENATAAVKQWRFRPGTKDGKPVTVQVQVAVDFRLM